MVPTSFNNASIPPEVLIFFREIKEHPDDDTPRLIFADWLQEHGDAAMAARGEFLRLQVLRHRLSPDDPHYGMLKRQEGELFREHRWTWLGPLVDAARAWTFERGMIQIKAESSKVSTPEVLAWARTAAALWIDHLTLLGIQHENILSLAYSPMLANVNKLDLNGNGGCRLLFQTLRRQSLRFLTHLGLARCRLPEGEIESLCLRHELLPRLTCLDLRRSRIPADRIALLRRTFGERVRF